MTDAPHQWEPLARANRHVRLSEQRIATRVLLIEKLRRHGCNPSKAERRLQHTRALLEAWLVHRDDVLRDLARAHEGQQCLENRLRVHRAHSGAPLTRALP
jgi:hypothetical protein